jgi:hypothetical protein
MFVLNMRVKVGTRIRLVFASGTYQFFAALPGARCERQFGLRGERYQDGHNPE